MRNRPNSIWIGFAAVLALALGVDEPVFGQSRGRSVSRGASTAGRSVGATISRSPSVSRSTPAPRSSSSFSAPRSSSGSSVSSGARSYYTPRSSGSIAPRSSNSVAPRSSSSGSSTITRSAPQSISRSPSAVTPSPNSTPRTIVRQNPSPSSGSGSSFTSIPRPGSTGTIQRPGSTGNTGSTAWSNPYGPRYNAVTPRSDTNAISRTPGGSVQPRSVPRSTGTSGGSAPLAIVRPRTDGSSGVVSPRTGAGSVISRDGRVRDGIGIVAPDRLGRPSGLALRPGISSQYRHGYAAAVIPRYAGYRAGFCSGGCRPGCVHRVRSIYGRPYSYLTFGFFSAYTPYAAAYPVYEPYPVPVYEPYPVPVPTPVYGDAGGYYASSTVVDPSVNAPPPVEGQGYVERGTIPPDAIYQEQAPVEPQPQAQAEVQGESGARMPVEEMQRLMMQGVDAFSRQNYDASAKAFLQVAMADPANADAWLAYAVARFATGEYEMAATAIRRGVKQYPEVVDSTFDIRERYGVPEDFARHLRALEEEVIDDPKDGDAWLTLGFVRHFSGQRDMAERAFRVIENRFPEDAELARMFLNAKPPVSAPEGEERSAAPGMQDAIQAEHDLRDSGLVQPSYELPRP